MEKKQKAPSPGELLGNKREHSSGKGKKHRHPHKHTHIEHHADGSHTVRHTPLAAGAPEVSYAARDLDAVHDGLEENVGTPGPGEVPAEQAGAGTPAPAVPPPGEMQ